MTYAVQKYSNNYTVPTIVTGGGINALGVVRSLGQFGIPVFVLDTDQRSPAMRSRWGRPQLVPSLEGNAFMAALRQLSKRLGKQALLFLTEEKTVTTVSQLRADLPDSVSIRLPQHERLMQLMHKQGFQELAEAVAARVPRLIRLQSAKDLIQLQTLKFPCILKPSEKNYEYGARFEKAYKVSSPEEVAQLYQEIEPVLADMVVQEWIEGRDAEIYFCMQYIGINGEVVASFPGRKIRSWPPRIGGTASCTSAWEYEQELTYMTKTFFHSVGFTGMGSMEYKRDARDGRFYMIEPTVARTDFQEEVATINGCNLPLACYCHELGLPISEIKAAKPPLIWQETQLERWSREETADQPDAASCNYRKVDAFRRWNDPLPWLDHMLERALLRLQR